MSAVSIIGNCMNGNNYSVIDNFVNSNNLPLNSGDATDGVPEIVTILSSNLRDASSDFLIHASLANINVHKLARFIFPREDPGPTIAGKTEVPDLNGLEYAVNLARHKLNYDLKSHGMKFLLGMSVIQRFQRMGFCRLILT